MPRIPDSMIPRLRERMMKMKQAPEPDPVETERKLMNFAGAAVRNLLRKGTSRKVIPLERCRAALLVPKTLSCEGVIIYLHGGGYCTGDLDYACLYGEVLASETGAVTFCPAYRLAPEDPFPAALDDALEAYERILNEYPGKPVSLIGESAGGGLCYALSMKLKEKGLPLPAGIVTLSPWTDLTLSGASHTYNRDADPSLTTEKLAVFAADYCAGADASDPFISPLFGDLAGLPESLIFVGGDEILLDDAVRMREALEAAGCRAELSVAEGLWHAYVLYGLKAREADSLKIRDFLRSRME